MTVKYRMLKVNPTSPTLGVGTVVSEDQLPEEVREMIRKEPDAGRWDTPTLIVTEIGEK